MSRASSPTPSGTSTPTTYPEDNQQTPVPHARVPFRFTYDPASRRGPGSVISSLRGPESVSGATEAAGRADLTGHSFSHAWSLNASSSALSIPSEWSSSKHGFHAISTVLNNPHKRQAPPKAHSALPSVPPADLPRVRRKDFDSYLNAVRGEWDKFESAKRELAAEADEHGSDPDVAAAPGDLPPTPTPTSKAKGKAKAMPPLDTVPPVFFAREFDLADSTTWDAITEHADPTALAHALPLLDKFSHYADTVEQHLTYEISVRSSSFFAALSNLHSLQSSSKSCLARIQELRAQLNGVDEGAKKGLEITRAEIKLGRLQEVIAEVDGVKGVLDVVALGRRLVADGMWSEALAVLNELQQLWDGRPDAVNGKVNGNGRLSPTREEDEDSRTPTPPPTSAPHPTTSIPLSRLKAFEQLPTHLRTLTQQISEELSKEVVSVLRTDLMDRIQSTPPPESEQEHFRAQREERLRDHLRPLLQALWTTKGVKDAIGTHWREEVGGIVKNVVREHLPSGSVYPDGDFDTKSNDTELYKRLTALTQPEFMVLIRALYSALLRGAEGVRDQGKLITEVLGGLAGDDASQSDLQTELGDSLSTYTETANALAARVISCRSEQHVQNLSLDEFVDLFNETWNFLVKCEVVCGRMIVSLRGAIVSQAKGFLQTFHQQRVSQSAKLLEDEVWKDEDCSEEAQTAANVIVDCAVKDSPALFVNPPTLPTSPSSDPHGIDPAPSMPSLTSMSTMPSGLPPSTPPLKQQHSNGTHHSSKDKRPIYIDSQPLYVVTATMNAVPLCADYLRVIANLPLLTTDSMGRAIEFFKAFNSRVCQVVLGAGAMRSAGLKNITAKHLALASQSLSVMIALIPYVRETFRRHLNPKQAVMLIEFDKMKRDLQEHQHEVHIKLIAIMSDRINQHMKALQAVDWESTKDEGVNGYMTLMTKETMTLHKVLTKFLALPVVEMVMTQVFAAINHRLSEEFTKIDLPHDHAKQRLLKDAKHFYDRVSTIKNVPAPSSNMVETVISEKRTRQHTPAPHPPARSSTINAFSHTANSRLRGLLSRSSTATEKQPLSPLPPTSPHPGPTSPHTGSVSPIFTGSSPPIFPGSSGSPIAQPLPYQPRQSGSGPPSRVTSPGPRAQSPLPPLPGSPLPPIPGSPLPVTNGHGDGGHSGDSLAPGFRQVVSEEPESMEGQDS
ncbi:Vps54-domain-containing protein [Schizophyllum commune Tattone D]|nr:Vps54-domain-containing protein [Schizophyllum commune Tattone D]